jgi:hypothetical protein
MEYRYEFADGPFQVIVTTSGEAVLAELVTGIRRVYADPRFRPEMNVLVDHSRLDVGDLTFEDVREVAASASSDRQTRVRTGQVVIVAPRPVQFGLARMYQSLASEQLEQRVTIFASVEEAYAWIAERTAPSSG